MHGEDSSHGDALVSRGQHYHSVEDLLSGERVGKMEPVVLNMTLSASQRTGMTPLLYCDPKRATEDIMCQGCYLCWHHPLDVIRSIREIEAGEVLIKSFSASEIRRRLDRRRLRVATKFDTPESSQKTHSDSERRRRACPSDVEDFGFHFQMQGFPIYHTMHLTESIPDQPVNGLASRPTNIDRDLTRTQRYLSSYPKALHTS